MAAHRYWRLRFTRPAGGDMVAGYIWLQEVSFRSATDGDLSVGGVASASSKWIPTAGDPNDYVPSGAFDKSMTGLGWCSAQGQFPCWLKYDHVTPVDVATVLVRPHASANTSYIPLDKFVFVEYSDDDITWTSMATFTNGYATGADSRLGIGDASSLKKRVQTPLLPYRAFGDQRNQSPRSGSLVKGGVWQWEVQTSGKGRIAGVVTIENIPGSRKVRLYRKHDGMLMRETWSATNGAYSFENLDPNWEYFVVSHDHLRVHNAVVSDMIDPP